MSFPEIAAGHAGCFCLILVCTGGVSTACRYCWCCL